MMTDRCFVDTNVLIYARDARFPEKQAVAISWLRVLGDRNLAVLSPQVVGEFHNAVLKKRILADLDEVHGSAMLFAEWASGQTDLALIGKAWSLRQDTGYQWWDCVILASALEAGCRYLLSEDYQHGHTIDGVTILNPFRTDPTAILTAS